MVASQHGIVVHASDLGIYGNCVIIDHGMGVMSLYGHMSSIGVKEGQDVQRPQESHLLLARTQHEDSRQRQSDSRYLIAQQRDALARPEPYEVAMEQEPAPSSHHPARS